MSLILTVTLNPSLDKTVQVTRLMPGREMRVQGLRTIDGGKGVNVARALSNLGVPSLSLTLKDLVPEVSPRVNTTVVEVDGRYTRFLEPGTCLTDQEWKGVERLLLGRLKDVSIVIWAGSLPSSAPVVLYGRLIQAARQKGVCSVLDSSGEALRCGIKMQPWGIKPNRAEAEEFLGMSIRSGRAVRKALQICVGYGMKRVLLSLGSDGLAGTDGKEMWMARGPRLDGCSVGCGDAALAGFLSAQTGGLSFKETVMRAAAAGTANVGLNVPGGISKKKVREMRQKIRMEKI